MFRQRSKWLIVAVIGSMFIAGCGSSSSSSTTSQSTPAATSSSSTATSTTQTASTPSTPSSSAAVADAVAECKSVIKEAPTLSGTAKAKVEAICNKAADGDVAGARAAAKEVCVEVINSTPIPSALKQHALAACKASN
jgi:predicted lipid-binding transport protein (Tim44 family)